MSLIKQKRPEFKSSLEISEYIKSKQEALQFWSMLKSVDMTEKIENLKNDIREAQKRLSEY